MGDQAGGVHADPFELLLEAQAEVEVRELGLAVGLPRGVRAVQVRVGGVDRAPLVVRDARDRHHPCSRRRQQRRHDEGGERPVAEVVHAELHLEAVRRGALRQRHQPGVVHQQVQHRVVRADLLRRVTHRGEVPEVEWHDLDGCSRGPSLDGGDRRGGLVRVPRGHHDVGARPRQGHGRLQSEAPVGAGHHRGAAGQVGDVGGGPGVEGHTRSLEAHDLHPRSGRSYSATT